MKPKYNTWIIFGAVGFLILLLIMFVNFEINKPREYYSSRGIERADIEYKYTDDANFFCAEKGYDIAKSYTDDETDYIMCCKKNYDGVINMVTDCKVF